MTLKMKAFENTVGKGENAGNHFSTMFSTLSRGSFNILAMFNLSSANAYNLNHSKILSFGAELSEGTQNLGCVGQLFTKQQNFRLVQIRSICR